LGRAATLLGAAALATGALTASAFLLCRQGLDAAGLRARPRLQTRIRHGGVVGRRAFDLIQAGKKFFSEDDDDDDSGITVPADIRELVAQMKKSTEVCLRNGIGHIDIELPPGFRLGVEDQKKKTGIYDLSTEANEDKSEEALKAVKEELAESDRELARLYVEMMQALPDGLVIAFRTKAAAARARRAWKIEDELMRLKGTVISFPEKAKGSFAQELGAPEAFKKQLNDLGCNCLIVVAPRKEQLKLVNQIRKEKGDQMGIFLLNSRIIGRDRESKLPPQLRNELLSDFVPSFHFRFWKRKNSVVYHRIGNDASTEWVVAQQKVLKVSNKAVTQEVLRSVEEPSNDQIYEAFLKYDAKDKDLGETLTDFFSN